jgi:hypothetical protein
MAIRSIEVLPAIEEFLKNGFSCRDSEDKKFLQEKIFGTTRTNFSCQEVVYQQGAGVHAWRVKRRRGVELRYTMAATVAAAAADAAATQQIKVARTWTKSMQVGDGGRSALSCGRWMNKGPEHAEPRVPPRPLCWWCWPQL